MAPSIDDARREVQDAVGRTLAWADSDETRSFHFFEESLWTLMLALGRALVVLFLARQRARERATHYLHGGRAYRLAEDRRSALGTRFGKVTFVRPVGRRVARPGAACDLPVDRELSLVGGFSLGVVVAVGRLCAQMAFAGARETFAQTYQWAPSSRATLRMVDALGDRARPFLEQAAVPDDDGEVLVIQADGRGAPMISEAEYTRRCRPRRGATKRTGRHERRGRRRERPRVRRTSGKKSKNAKVAIVGAIYTLKETPRGLEGPINKRLYATFESHEALFIWLRREADKRGYGRKPTLFLGDGSDHIWRNQQRYFPEAEVCLDWYHVVEKVWAVGECLYAAGSRELADWVGQMTSLLRRGKVDTVLFEMRWRLSRLPKTGPGNKWRRRQLTKTIDHFAEHAHRMQYAALRARDLDIGTGVIEGAVRNLVGMRFDGPGMRWGRDRAERLLHLRCILLNGQCDEFARYVAETNPIALAAQPAPARPHTAKAAA
jgi:hypothetical protein